MPDSKGTIVYIGGFEMPDKNAAAHRVLNIAKILNELNYRVCFCGVDREIACDAKKSEKIGFYYNRPAKYPASTGEWLRQMSDFSHISSTIEEYDNVKFVIAYNMHAWPLTNLIRYCRKKKIVVISDLTEWYENKPNLNPVKLIKYIDTLYVMKYLQKKVDAIISISSYLAEYYGKYVQDIVTIPPLIDVTERIWRAEPTAGGDIVEFVYTGTTDISKDRLDIIIKAFEMVDASHRNYHLSIVGLTCERFYAVYPQGEGVFTEIGDRIEFFGQVSHDESVRFLKTADYCIFVREPSRKNNAGFPTKFVECLTAGCGIVTNNISDIRKYFPTDGSGFLIDRPDYRELSDAIMAAIERNDKLGRMERKTPNDKFDYHNYKILIADLLNHLEK